MLAIAAVSALGWMLYAKNETAAQAITERQGAEKRLAEAEQLSATRDALLDDLLESTTLIAEVSEAISGVQSGQAIALAVDGEQRRLTPQEARPIIMARIDSLRVRLAASQDRYATTARQLQGAIGTQERMQQQLAEYARSITALQAMVNDQQGKLEELGRLNATLVGENQQLLAEQAADAAIQAALQDSLRTVNERDNTVYWIAGTEKELRALGIVTKEGGNILGGGTLQPARTLDPAVFRALPKDQAEGITLPKPDKSYQVVTKQNLAFISPQPGRDSRVRGQFRITEPGAFWASSRFLILVER